MMRLSPNIKFSFLRLFFLTLALSFVGVPAFAFSVENIRFGNHPDKTRLVLEMSDKADFRTFMLSSPYRMVIDLPDFEWRLRDAPVSAQAGVTGVRKGQLEPGISRIVFDLNGPKAIKSAFFLPGQGEKLDRLVIDFESVTPAAFSQIRGEIYGHLTGGKQLPAIAPYQTASLADVAPAAPKPRPKVANARKPLIVIDPGHGGQDPGAIGANGAHEKTVVFELAKELKKQLESTGKYRILMTRTSDKYIRLHERVAFARKHEADLFVSIHADSIEKSNVRGASIYTLSEKASDAQTARLAVKENLSDAIAGFDVHVEDKEVSNILVDLAMRDTMNQSKFFANTVVSQFTGQGVQTLQNPHRYAGFAVLKAADIPSILIEAGFMSNKKEAAMLARASYREKIAAAMVRGINAYFHKVQLNQSQ